MKYSILYFFFWTITALPLWVQYFFSDCFYLAAYYLVGYRRKVVRGNLTKSFPEKPLSEIISIEKKFYRHFSDIFIEMMCQMHLSEKQIKKRMQFKNPELIIEQFKKNKSVMVMTAHYANWEWLSSMAFHLPAEQTFYGIYKQLSNPAFDKLMSKIRQRYKGKIIESKSLYPTMLRMKNSSINGAFFMIADQRPAYSGIRHWVQFLNQETPVLTGTEQLARKFNYPVLLMNVKRLKRGHYLCEFEMIEEEPARTSNFEITERYMSMLEDCIKAQPEYWLWTHNRWKHKRRIITE